MRVTPNQLTFLRILLALIIPVFIFHRTLGSEAAAILAFVAACVTDWWDGHIARRNSMITPLGKILDPLADKLLILGSMLSFAGVGLYSYGWVLLIVFREVVVTAMRVVLLQRGRVVAAEQAGKIKFGFQVGSITATFIYSCLFFLKDPQGNLFLFWRGVHYLGIILANVITVYSGVIFFYRLAKNRGK